jgi:hypothetical protein
MKFYLCKPTTLKITMTNSRRKSLNLEAIIYQKEIEIKFKQAKNSYSQIPKKSK